MQSRVLTLTEEKDILQYGIGDYIDDGSSRRTHKLTLEYRDKYGFPCNCVVKIAKGIGGQRQNTLEINTFLECDDADTFLANIFAFGRYIIIMEEVEPEDWSDLADNCEDTEMILEDCTQRSDESRSEFEIRYNKLEKSCEQAEYAINRLSSLFGTTGDNGQLGRTYDGRLVAYDYGFETEKGCSFYCTTDSVAQYCEENFEDYVEELIDLLQEEEDTLTAWETNLTANLRERYRQKRMRNLPYSTKISTFYVKLNIANARKENYWDNTKRYAELEKDINNVRKALTHYIEDAFGFGVIDFEFMKKYMGDTKDKPSGVYVMYNIKFDTDKNLW